MSRTGATRALRPPRRPAPSRLPASHVALGRRAGGGGGDAAARGRGLRSWRVAAAVAAVAAATVGRSRDAAPAPGRLRTRVLCAVTLVSASPLRRANHGALAARRTMPGSTATTLYYSFQFTFAIYNAHGLYLLYTKDADA